MKKTDSREYLEATASFFCTLLETEERIENSEKRDPKGLCVAISVSSLDKVFAEQE